jgi:hypothetical protein
MSASARNDLSAQEYELVPIDSLNVHPRNARQGDVGAIHESITQNGFFGACLVQKSTRTIIAGNHRYMAAEAAGMDQVPVIWADVDDDRALRILLADNKTNDDASYDDAKLADILTELAALSDLSGTGYNGDDLDRLISDLGGDLGAAIGGLPSGDKSEFEQMTFTLHATQAALVRTALAEAHGNAQVIDTLNANSNGNALAVICEAYVSKGN